MKKLILGIVIGLIVGGVPVFAWQKFQGAKPLLGFDCDWSGPYYDNNPNGQGYRCSGTVFVFDDSGNKCYIAKGGNAAGISCVKEANP